MTINGYDIDGVICELFKADKSFRQSNGVERKYLKELKNFHMVTARKLRNPEGLEIYLITGRKEKDRGATLQWLRKNEVKFHKLLMLQTARTRENMIEHKKRMIEYYNIDTFYEDDPKIAKKLQKLLPKVKVELVDSSCNIKSQKDLEKELKAFRKENIFDNMVNKTT